MHVENFEIRAYYHRRELKKCYLLFPEPMFDIRFGRLVRGDKYLGMRQKKNTFDLHDMRVRVHFFLQEHSWEDGTYLDIPVKGLWVPDGVMLDALEPKRVLGEWSGYGDYQTFGKPTGSGSSPVAA